MKNGFWAFLIAILIITPTAVAIGNYFVTKDSPVTANSISEITIVDPDNKSGSFGKTENEFKLDSIGNNMVEFFTRIFTESKANGKLPDTIRGTEYYKVTVKNYNRDIDYKFYFTESPERCYYTEDKSDDCYAIPFDYATAFLNSPYGRSVFSSATLPKMTTPSGDIIEPTAIKWKYLAANGAYPVFTQEDSKAYKDTVYTIAQPFNIIYSIPASTSNVTITQNGTEIYNGLLDSIAYAKLPTYTALEVSVDAKWYSSPERQAEGEANYKFKCMVTDIPVFHVALTNSELECGDYLAVSALNIVGDTSCIKFTSTPDIGTVPEFYKDGNVYRALLPIDLDTEPGNYVLDFSVDGVEQSKKSVEITVVEKDYGTKYENASENVVLDEAVFASFDAEMGDLLNAPSEELYFAGEFSYHTAGSISSGFARTTVTAEGYTYTNKWVRLRPGSDSAVYAINAGKVVYVGKQTLTGNTVVIDHGLGLKSVYGNFTSTDVSVGDVVSAGDKIGTSGASGYAPENTVSLAMIINGVYVSPYPVWYDDAGNKNTMGIIFADK